MMIHAKLDLDDIAETIRRLLPEVWAVYLFGSQLHGCATIESDVDVAVLLPKTLDPLFRWQLECDLARMWDRDVDLVDLRAASTVMQYQILWTGQCLLRCDGRSEMFEAMVCNLMDQLNHARALYLDDIARTGRIYGQ